MGVPVSLLNGHQPRTPSPLHAWPSGQDKGKVSAPVLDAVAWGDLGLPPWATGTVPQASSGYPQLVLSVLGLLPWCPGRLCRHPAGTPSHLPSTGGRGPCDGAGAPLT